MSEQLPEEQFDSELDLPESELTEEQTARPYDDLGQADDYTIQDPEAQDVHESE